MIEIIKAEVEHGALLAPLRPTEQKALDIAGKSAHSLVEQIVPGSDMALTAMIDGQAACMWGIQQESILSGAHIWMITTALVDKHPKLFLKLSRRYVERAITNYGLLYGYVASDFKISCRWMEWLGFEATTQHPELNLIRYELRAR
jgi:hypothetical protein